MNRWTRPVLALALWGVAGVAAAQVTGSVAGKVVDGATGVALVGAAVQVRGADMGAFTDDAGAFAIPSVPVGTYALEVRMFGYAPRVLTDVVVKSGRATVLAVELATSAFELEAVVVRPSYFPAPDREPTSAVAFSAEEVRRAPGSGGDVSRIVMALPSLAKVNDQSNSLIVRGGSPMENAFLVDGIEVPNINHFPTQGASGGPIGILNVDLIRDVRLLAGGFSAEHGDRLSSVMEVKLREGDRTGFQAQTDLSFAGFGGVLEGPLAGSQGSWVVSARRSYVDLVVDVFDVGATVAPRYGDYQGKVVLDVAPGHTVSVLGVWADDHMRSDLDQALENAMLVFGRQDILQGTTGAAWTALWSDRARSTTTLAYAGSWFDETFTETASNSLFLRNRSREGQAKLRHLTGLQLAGGVSLEVGGEAARVGAVFNNRYGRHVGPLGDTVPEVLVDRDITGARLGAFASLSAHVAPRLTATVGGRIDHFSLTSSTTASPRASLAYQLTPRTSLSAAAGIYRQSLPVLLLAQSDAHRQLRDPRAVHVVLGVSHLLTDDTRLTMEAYRKDYDFMPVDPAQGALFPLDELFYDYGIFTARESMTDTGAARSEGIEALLQKKLANDVYGLASAAWFRARYRGADGAWRDRVFDNRVVLALEGGYRPGTSWEFSARWIYAGGAPYTPFDLAASEAAGRAVLDASRVNQARYPDYHALNVRVDRRFNFRRANLIVYLSAWNAYDRENVASYYWNAAEGRPAAIRQWGLLPILGAELEF